MRERKHVGTAVILYTLTLAYVSYGCQIVDHSLWTIPIHTDILDTFEVGEIVISRETTDIEEIDNVSYGQATLGGPYFDLSIENSQLVVRTNAEFRRYEEVEVASRVAITVDFRCTGGGTRGGLILWIDIIDTNNNPPEFIPSDQLEFIITPPLPPGFLITGCLNDVITVRDIDLTTQRIDFTIEDNPYFDIEYDAAASTVAKHFVGQLRTKTLIRSLDDISLSIGATDVDLTDGPPRTKFAVVRIVADSEFQFPEEPQFDQTFYLANYTDDHQLNLLETISLRQGFDEYVNFTLAGDYYENFDWIKNGNDISIVVVNPLPEDVLSEGHNILLIIRADREYTSGDSATIIVQFPEVIELQFERGFYEGTIMSNILNIGPLVLTQGYEGSTVSAQVVGEYSNFFTAAVQGNQVILTMGSITNDIIENNNFISLEVLASNDRSSVTTVVNLEIIKDDSNTPLFEKSIYSGSYDAATGFTMEQIRFVQGFDDTVNVDLVGEHADYFQISEIGPVMTITASRIPPELFSLQNMLITIEATKPRTVGANAAIHIALPAARELEFEESSYRGSLEDSLLSLETILLRQGYEAGVTFSLSGEYSTYFTATNQGNLVTIVLSSALPDTAVQNSAIMLTLTASGVNAISTTTNILLDIIKEDTTTPVFGQHIYYGTYSGGNVEIDSIDLAQGYDSSVLFRIAGVHSQYFAVRQDGNNAAITLQYPIPEDVIFSEKVLLFNVLADKALTVGANAAVLIRFPTELTDSTIMRFSRNTYVGSLEQNQFNLEDIILDTGFVPGTQFILQGDYREHFSYSTSNNIVQITSLNTLPNEVLEENSVIVLELEARRERAVSVWTSVVIDIVKQEVTVPVFGQAYYTGVYTEDIGLTFEETINLSEGYDETVTFTLVGEPEAWFSIEGDNNVSNLISLTPVPAEVLERNNQLLFTIVANKPNAPSGRAVISLDLPKDFADSSFRFQQNFYEGTLENGNLRLNDIILGDYTNDVTYTYTGDYVNHFHLNNQDGTFTIHLETPLPDNVVQATNVFVLTLEARNTNIRTHTVIIIENIKPNIASEQLEFEETYYIGSYSTTENLQFDTEIRLATETLNVVFGLQGEQAEWFDVVPNGNSATVVLTSPIPAAVISNNQQLVFVVTAQGPGSATARATVIITLVDSFPEGTPMLGFDRVTYLGSIENNQATIPTITLSEGYTQGVQFSLHGELENYFSLSPQGAVVTVTLQREIPEALIPANRVIVLEIQASATNAITAYATIVIDYVVADEIPSLVELIFAQTFYYGSYASATGLSFPTAITLTRGYDTNVQFALEGDNAEWFDVVSNGNSATVVLTSPIPAAVISNNQQLVFVVTAQGLGSATARATVIITLVDSFPEGTPMLGFDRVTYLGSIENNQATIPTITLSEGYTQGVQFSLHGELENYFSLSPQGAVVTVTLQREIPEALIPANRVIVLEIQASATNAITAYATIVIDYVVADEIPSLVELIFAQTFYYGSYASATGLSFPTAITLTQGYDTNVQFALEGDNAEWFDVVSNGNSATVVLTSPIPAAVISNNQQLVFVVTAQGPGSATARATVIITLVDSFPEGTPMLGFDRVTYLGSIENNQATIPTITLSEGYTQGVQFSLHGELENYFSLSPQGAVVTVTLQREIPEALIPANRVIVLEIQASATNAITAYATIVIDYVVADEIPSLVELIFAQTFYYGSYASATGLSFPTAITLTQGYDTNVQFALEGDNAEWFDVVSNGNSATVVLTSPIPAAVISNNQQLVFVVTAQGLGSATARATVIITLVDSFPEGTPMLGFDRVTYLGSIENNQATIPTITLSEGYTQGVQFSLHGELENYFSLSPQGAVVTVTLQREIPEALIPANRVIVLEIQASATNAITAYATIVIDYVVADEIPSLVELIFAQTFYYGSYASATGLSFPTAITLTQGYDTNVQFALEGDNAEWFDVVSNGNSATVVLTSPIPAAVISNNQQLVFVVTAQGLGSATARATVIITLVDSFPEGTPMLGFDRVTYLGSIENNQATIPTITLSEGYTQGVQFSLHGELENYFSLSPQGAVVTVTLQREIPEALIPANRVIVLEIQASATNAITAYATIVIDYVVADEIPSLVELIFAQTFYYGSYASATGLSFPTAITLTQGYDTNVQFALEGDNAEWFDVVPNGNSATVVLTSPIPAAVISNNQQLVFVVTAQGPGSATARATVIITLVDSFPEGTPMLGFDRVTYLGSIENNQATIPTITLSEGYTQGVQFSLHGELENYFSLSPQGAVVTVTLQREIPEALIPANRVIVLEIQASATNAITAYATIVIDYVVAVEIPSLVELIFAQTFYYGSYASATGLSFPTAITLTQGYDTNVQFALEGDNAEWFDVVPNGNSATVVLTSPIPAAVISNNQQLVFVVTAQGPGSATARATVIITLVDSFPEGTPMLGFDRVTYLGSIENNQATIPTITLSEGYTQGVQFSLHGELENYFSLSPQGAVVTVTLQREIPEALIPANRVIVLEIQASATNAITAYATIVIDYVVADEIPSLVELIFAQTFYYGSYASATGLSFPTAITLTQGYDTNVQFALEGDNAEWFDVVPNGNSATVVLTNPIPAAVISNNQQLVFVVTAQGPGSATARATVIITLVDSFPEGTPMLGFDRVTYLGSIENNEATIPTITLSEGYTQGVQFSLHGELENYFSLSPQGAVVTVTLQREIPEALIPANRVIVLEIQASATNAITAYATIVIDYVVADEIPSLVELIFAQTFYYGSYASATGLSFPTAITLTQGYDTNVQFALEGDNAEWFDVVSNGNSATVVLTSPIPAAVISNNQQLVFVVTAQGLGSATARATVIITLVDSFPEGTPMLGFDRVTYLGSIENNQATIPTITLSEGYTQGVQFSLHGELENYFSLSPQGAVVTVTLQREIPEALIPANRVIVLEIQASATNAITAYATIVIDYVVADEIPSLVELIFAQTFYYGSYASAMGLSFPTAITLTQGYDTNVQFALEGDNAEWFDVVPNGNSATVVLTSPIPAAVISNNQQLVFVVAAQGPGSATARATVIITLVDSFPEGTPMLGFDRVTYLGSIENNQATIPTITLIEGYTQSVQFSLHGELENYFSLSPQGAVVTVTLQREIPEALIPANRVIVLEIQASATNAITAYATIVIDYVVADEIPSLVELIFAQTFYYGSYASATGLSFPTAITLTQGYDTNVQFALEGDNAEWFDVVPNGNSATVVLTNPIPAAVISNNQQLVFVVTAQGPGSATARATVIITLVDSFPEGTPMLGFDRVTYLGSIENNQATIPTITLSEGYTQGVQFSLHGELENYFSLSPQGAVVTVTLQREIPEALIPANRVIVLEIKASATNAITAYATIVIDYVVADEIPSLVELIFAQTFYYGSYASATGLSFPTAITLTQGYDTNVQFALEGDNAEWFDVVSNGNSATVVLTSPIPAAVISNNQQLVFVVTAQGPGSATARATVIITLVDSFPEGTPMLGFDRVTYLGSIENNQATIPTITLSEGYTQGVQFSLHGELENYFSLSPQGAVVTVTLQREIPEALIPANRVIVLEIQASATNAITAYATIVIDYVVADEIPSLVELIFAQTFYYGSYASATGLSFPTAITLTQGYDTNVQFALEGDNAEWFDVVPNGNSAIVVLTSPIPAAVISNNQQLVFVVTAQGPGSATARATIIISTQDDSQPGSDVYFDKVLYEGLIQNGVVSHETVTVIGFSGSTVELHGEYSSMFTAVLSTDRVTVSTSGSLTLPGDVSHVVLELRAGTASAVLLLNVIQTDVPPTPTVTFMSTSYAVRVDIAQTGLVGQTQATADNGEAVTYSLLLDNVHLQERLTINGEGELHLSAPLNMGYYTFEAIATTVFTQVQGTALVHLSVEAITVCGDELFMHPLITLDVDEEEPHNDLINGTVYDNCHFTLTSHWPLDQTWVYVDEGGLHTTAIDREHASIAFMPLSQVQVEVILHCEGDTTRLKRSVTPDLGPYDYGSNKWILTNTIHYNSRRSLVNIIVNDINDNAPIFEGKANEPIAVGYPIPELAERVLPRSLAELKASDADIGDNAALRYWSSAPELAVAPTTGFVHLRDGATLENGARLTVSATDRNGAADGLTGTIDILVRLLDESYVAVVTVRDAFLDDEDTVISTLSEFVGYEIKVLRSVVISDEGEAEFSRKKRDVTSASGASLQLYVYGMVAREPVSVQQLTADISNIVTGPVIVASSVSLQDHLEGQEICVIAGRDTGLLVATIVLSVLLFVVLVLIGVWFFLRWRKNRNYDQFSDDNSLASRDVSEDKFPKTDTLPKPRLDIAELKKSERRLQEMLDAPIQEISVEPTSSRNDAILNMPEELTPSTRNDGSLKMPEPLTPIVIQSIDKLKDGADDSSEDEFGEIKTPRRKSVVTFNENVEKIIHVEDTEDLSADPDYEVYKL